MTMSDVLTPNHVVAQRLAEAGYRVFPCHEGGPSIKAPMPGVFWQSASTSDIRAIDQWWRRWPTAAVGIDVAKSDIIVIDADMKHGIDGVAALHDLLMRHGCAIDDFPHVSTPNNGIHVYFKQRPGHRLGNSTGDLPKGIDVRGAGGLIIAPGTVMGDDREYVPHGDVSDAVELPQWLFDLLAPRVAAQPASTFVPRQTAVDDVAELEELLTYISADCSYGDWCAVLMGIHSATGGSGDGLSIADRWSATAGSRYAGQRAIERKWQSFKSDGVTRATIAKMAEDGGADLAEISWRHSGHEDRPVSEEDRRISEALWQSFERKAGIVAESAPSELEWFDNVQPVTVAPYIVKGVLDRAAMSVVYGPSNSGKTFFALDLAYHVAVAAPWRGRRVDGGSVLYLAAEGGNGIANRIAGLRSTFGSVDVPLALRRAGLDLLKPNADVKRVIALAAEVTKREPIRLIVVDTLSRVIAGGDENAASDMTAFIRNVDAIKQATGAHILIVHHTGKDAAKGARGHSSLRAATDTEIEIATDDFGGRVAKVTKQRDYDGGEEFRFTLKPVHLGTDQDGDKVSTCIVEAEQEDGGARPDDMPPMATCKAILDELSLAFNKGNPYSMTPQSQRTGRYAPRALGKKFNIEIGAMDRLLKAWLDNEIVMSSSFDKRNGRSGLTVIGSIG